MKTVALSPNLEDYLEAIYQIASVNKVARSMEIADRLDVKRSSVTVALRALAEKGLINYQVRSYVTLTEKGLGAARCVDRRHHILHDLFKDFLGLPEQEADDAACRMEHGMTAEVCRKMAAFVMAMRLNPEETQTLTNQANDLVQTIDCTTDCGYIPAESNEEELMNLNFLLPGQGGIIARIIGSGSLKKRLQEMGITRGQEIRVIRAAPLDDPIEVKVKNFHLSLRREEAALVLVSTS